MVPCGSQRVEDVKVVKALGVGTRSTKEIKFLSYVAKGHTGSGCGTLTFDNNLRPLTLLKIYYKKIVKTFSAVPTPKNVKVGTDY
jgi:hypothetical protein